MAQVESCFYVATCTVVLNGKQFHGKGTPNKPLGVFKYENLKLNTAPLKLIRYPNQLPLVDFFVKSFSRRREAARFQSPFCSLKACRSLKVAKFKKLSALFFLHRRKTCVRCLVNTSNDDNFNEFLLEALIGLGSTEHTSFCSSHCRRPETQLGASLLSLSAEREQVTSRKSWVKESTKIGECPCGTRWGGILVGDVPWSRDWGFVTWTRGYRSSWRWY